MHSYSWTLCFLMVLAALASTGCGYARSSLAGSLMADVAAATAKHDDVTLVSQAVPTFLLLLEGMIEEDPDNRRLLIEAAKGYTSYGVLVEAEDPERAHRVYSRAMDFGRRAVLGNDRAAGLLNAPYRDFAKITIILDRKDLEAVFWTASAWGAWISLNTGSMAALADLPRVILLMEWVLEQDETYQGGSPHIFLGVYHAALPPMLGGKPEKARFHFERALELTEEQSAIVFVQMAKFYAVQQFDRELYVSLLERALAIPTGSAPELTLQNEAAHRQARRLLLATDDIF